MLQIKKEREHPTTIQNLQIRRKNVQKASEHRKISSQYSKYKSIFCYIESAIKSSK